MSTEDEWFIKKKEVTFHKEFRSKHESGQIAADLLSAVTTTKHRSLVKIYANY